MPESKTGARGGKSALYDEDFYAWANEQAALLRSGQLSIADIDHIAEEIESMGKTEKRELISRLKVLLMHLLKWQFQPERRSNSWVRTIKNQRERIALAMRRTPSLKSTLADADWQREMWLDGIAQAENETGFNAFPDACPWPWESVLDSEFFPDNP